MNKRLIIYLLALGAVSCVADPAGSGPIEEMPVAAEQPEPVDEVPDTDEPDPVEEPVKDPEPEPEPDPVEPAEPEPTPSFGEWYRTFGGLNADIVEDVAADAEGNVYVTGTFRDELPVGTEQLVAVAGDGEATTDVFVASFSPEGDFRWARSFGSAENEKPFGIETSPDGDVFVVGNSQGLIAFDASVLAHRGQGDLFAVKFSPDGDYRWSQSWGGQFTETARDIAVNAAGDLYITGAWQGLFVAGSATYSAETDWSAMEVLVLAIDGSSGAVKWSNSFNGFLVDTGTAIAADAAGNVVVGLSYQYDLDINGAEFEVGDSYHAAIVRLGPSGEVTFANTYGVDGEVVEVTGIGVTADGHTYATGVFSGTQNFGGEDLANPVRGHDAFVLGLNEAGEHLFSHRYGGEGFDQPLDLVVAASGDFSIAGRFDGELVFGETELLAVGGYDMFVATFSGPTGELRGARSFGGPEDDQANGIAADPWTGIYVAGYTGGGAFEFGDDAHPATGEWVDAAILRLEN